MQIMLKMMRRIGDFTGDCNVQFDGPDEKEKIIAIEINPRVSRSSALASVSGYPITKSSCKTIIRYSLDELN